MPIRLVYLSFWQRRLPIIVVAAALVVLALISVSSVQSINEFQRRGQSVERTHEIISKIEEIMSLVRDAESGGRGFVIAGRREFLETVNASERAVPEQLTILGKMVQDPVQSGNVGILRVLVAERFSALAVAIRLRQQSTDINAMMAELSNGTGRQAMERVRAHVGSMQSVERTQLARRAADAADSAAAAKGLILFGTTAAYLMIGGAFWWLTKEVRQRRHAEKAVAEASQALLVHANNLEAANQELESFSYSVSHDLRVPLRAISGYTRMVEEDYGDKLDSEGHRLLHVIRSSAGRMGQLIDDLLTFSRLGRKNIVATEVDVNDIVASALDELHRKDKPAKFEIEVADLPAAWGDRALLYQVWINLISNAIKYSQRQPQPTVRISATTAAGEVTYAICDNGVGFDMQYAHKLFGVFQRLHAADEFPGTGVGLAIVHRIVTRHGGRVWADAVLGQGATFFFALPVKG